MVLTAGLGGMGGAQPLAAVMAGASMIAVECDPQRIEKRIKSHYLDVYTNNLDEALDWIFQASETKEPISIGLLANAADIYSELVKRNVRPDLVTDQTSAHDPLNGYLPRGWSLEEACQYRQSDPEKVIQAAKASMALQVRAMLAFASQNIPVFDYGNNIRQICWVGLKDRARLALAFNEMVQNGEVRAPIVIGRDHLDSGSVASPNRETEGMLDGSDAVSDWPLLNALLNCASGATWVSIHHGGGVGMGFSQHAGVVIVADGSQKAAERLVRVLHNDPATGVMRHADAGYPLAQQCARDNHLWLPMMK